MSIDLAGSLRRRKLAKRTSQLSRRGLKYLVDVTALPSGPVALLLDTNVYINEAAGRLGARVREAIGRALLFHCSVALAELSVGVANADPSRLGWRAMQDHYADLFASIPTSRVVTPDAGIWVEAGVIAGSLARTQRFQPDQRKECLNDALIFLTAAKAGVPVLTSDRGDFDLIQQLAPEGGFVHC